MDPENPIIRLCTQGMLAETEGRQAEARELFRTAWESAGDDYERCVAAHYLARHQPDAAQTLEWNQECLRLADAVGDARVAEFYPSLHLNLARSLTDLGRTDEAAEQFRLASARLDDVPDGEYADSLRAAVAQGLPAHPADGG
jgi:tetratricopeptide (TPR) repeat protein